MPRKTNGRRRIPPWFGPWLREQREADIESNRSGSEMDDVAERLGRSKSAVSRIETGLAIVSADDLPFILRAYRRTPEDFAAAARKAPKAAA